MPIASEELEASHLACRRLTRASGSNFSAAFCLLPAAKKRAMHALYAFMRYSDDLADDQTPAGGNPCDVLREWRAALMCAVEAQGDTQAGRVDPRGTAILPAVAQTVREFRIPIETLLAVLDGVEMDLVPRVYESFDELAIYCERVASAVGLACMHIWGFEGDAALPAGRSAGIALQMTNILRDLSEDARRGRVYIPQEDLRESGYTVNELRRGVVNDSFLRLMRLEIERTTRFYREANDLLHRLHKDGRRIYGLMMDRYFQLLRMISRRPGDVFSHRIRLSRWQKLWLAVKWTLLPPLSNH
jgi:phytoene synthase